MNILQERKRKKRLWSLPWGYSESFIIILSLFVVSLGIETFSETAAPVIAWPWNMVSLILLGLLSWGLYKQSKRNPFFSWFYSVPASIAGITLFVVPTLLMALVPQQEVNSHYFLFNVTSSWTYTIGVLFFLIILGTVIFKRLSSFTTRNVGFFLNHFGLWLCIASAHLGAGDIQKLNMYLEEGKTVWYGVDKENKIQELDFAIQLRDFSIEEYPSKIAFVERSTGELIQHNHKPCLMDIHEGLRFHYKDANYKVDKLCMSSAPVQERFEPLMAMGATQSAKIVKQLHGEIDTLWISSPSILYKQKIYPLDSATMMLMIKPEVKRFLSEITVFKKSGKIYDRDIEVNKPIRVNGWKIYQTSYNESMGRWSTQSTLELVKDPWLVMVYLGCFIWIVGTFYLIWTGKRKETL